MNVTMVDYSGFRLDTFVMLISFLIYLQQKNPWAALLQKLVRSKKARYATWEKEEKNCFNVFLFTSSIELTSPPMTITSQDSIGKHSQSTESTNMTCTQKRFKWAPQVANYIDRWSLCMLYVLIQLEVAFFSQLTSPSRILASSVRFVRRVHHMNSIDVT